MTTRIPPRTRPLPPFRVVWAFVLAAVALPAAPPSGLLAQMPPTGAERADFDRTSAHAEVLDFLMEVRARSDHVLVEELTVTNQGRVLPIVYLGDPPTSDPGAALLSGKPTVLFTGSVHGNERAGKEGSQQLIRELALGELRPLLERVNVLIVPSLNPDGAERPGRTNSLDYDMNRDFIVAETPEISALLEVLTTWEPDVFVDVHNGGAYPYNVTYQATLHPAADPDLVAFARGPMYDAIGGHLGTQGMTTYWYSGPRETEDGWIWRTTEPWARKQHTYGGLQNMITLLFEIPGRWSLEEQADNARETMEGMVRFVADNADAVRGTVLEARRRTVESPPSEIPLEIEATAYPEEEQFWVIPERGAEPELVTGENRTLYVPTRARSWPWAYAFDGRFDEVAEHLRRHGLEVERLTAPARVPAERYRITALEWADAPYQNHLLADVAVELEPAMEAELPAGTYLARTRQHGARLLTQMMEPDTEDSLVTWNFFDHTLPSPGAVADPDEPEYLDIVRIPTSTPVESLVVR
ncbi:MAG TPA: M14 family zinc carboxypeptidase [Longimicrobiales bacterium]|nr:M14 family zinc carboxypeptidase [Longimicrobiales bacterium]